MKCSYSYYSQNPTAFQFQSKGKTSTKTTLGATEFPFQLNMGSKNSGKINLSSKNQGNSKFDFQFNQLKSMNLPKTNGQNDKIMSMINFNLGQKSKQKLGKKKIQQGQKTEKKTTGKFNLESQLNKAEGRWTQKPYQDEQ